jgi:hypothetical protein
MASKLEAMDTSDPGDSLSILLSEFEFREEAAQQKIQLLEVCSHLISAASLFPAPCYVTVEISNRFRKKICRSIKTHFGLLALNMHPIPFTFVSFPLAT